MENGRYLYEENFDIFCKEDKDKIFGIINDNYQGAANSEQKDAWKEEISILQSVLKDYKDENGKVIFEYNIPRLGKRIDAVLLLKGIVFCLEFKVGQSSVLTSDIDQVLDYALDLNNFHKFSDGKVIAPVLIATEYTKRSKQVLQSAYNDMVIDPLITGKDTLLEIIRMVIKKFPNENEIESNWSTSPYEPTPTIIEAARLLYENHSVEDIKKKEALREDTDKTIDCLLKVIAKSKANHEKSICFVTGVPGAGKTLVGLDVAIRQTYTKDSDYQKKDSAVYLSGNGPLVAVLREALAINYVEKEKGKKKKKNITDARREVGTFIQNIHQYRDEMLKKIKIPVENGSLEIDPDNAVERRGSGYSEFENIAIFDEAQRTWTHERLASYLKRGGTYGNKTKVPNFPCSEAAFLIWSLDLRKDWAVIICLVGGGQEINSGEAGISEWITALKDQFPHWKIYISDRLTDVEYAEGKVNDLLKNNHNVTYCPDLHLAVSLRSFRAEKLSQFVHYLLDLDLEKAKSLFSEIRDRYPIYLTRSMDEARKWIRIKTRGTERSGVLVSKESARYKPMAVHVLPNNDKDTVHWFLDDKSFPRASNFLEDAVTEIQVQGLELDYVCLLWDADLRYKNGKWRYYTFNSTSQNWVEVKDNDENKKEKIKYMLNAYRVLLTRARKGMVICVPEGNPNRLPGDILEDNFEDPTRLPEFYQGTYDYLSSLGIPSIDQE